MTGEDTESKGGILQPLQARGCFDKKLHLLDAKVQTKCY